MHVDKEKFKELGITFEEKAFFDILVAIRNEKKFEYPDEKCIALSKKIKELVDGKAIYANFLHNDNLRNELSADLAFLLYKEGYPPTWSDDVFAGVLEQVENYKKYNPNGKASNNYSIDLLPLNAAESAIEQKR